MTENAADLRAQAAQKFEAEQESFDRCDTDGFLSQWASNITGRKLLLQAQIVENGGKAEFVALFDLEGNLVPAKMIETRFGWSWALLDPENPRGRFLGFFNPSKAATPEKRRAANAKKGYRLGKVMAPAVAEVVGGGKGLAGAASCYVGARRTDGGFSTEVDVIDNGTGETSD